MAVKHNMVRRKVIPTYKGVFGVSLFGGIILVAGFSWILPLLDREASDYREGIVLLSLFLASGWSLIGLSLYFLVFGFSRAEYTVDSEGMTVYLRKKTYRLRWEECVEFGVAKIMLNQVSSIGIVYCTTKITTPYERNHFLKCRKNDYAHTLYFQVSDQEAFREFLNCLPDKARTELAKKALSRRLV